MRLWSRVADAWFWVVVGLVVVFLVLAPGGSLLVGSGPVIVEGGPGLGGWGYLALGMVMVAGIGILAALLLAPRQDLERGRR